MRLMIFSTTIFLCCSQIVAAKNFKNLEIEMGALNVDGEFAHQVISVINKTDRPIKQLFIECTYYNGKKLLASAADIIRNIDVGEMGSADVLAGKAAGTDNVKCRTVSAE